MLAHGALQMQAGAGAGGGPSGPPPAAPPGLVGLYNYDGTKIGVAWTNGDATASTQLGFVALDTAEPGGAVTTRPPGDTTYETGFSGTIAADDGSGSYWWARHIKNGQVTAWVRCSQMIA